MCPYKYWRISLQTLAPKASDRDVEVTGIKKTFKRDEEGKPTTEVVGHTVEFLAIRGTTQAVKLPLSSEEKIKELQEILDREAIVRIKFVDLDMKVYSMLGANGKPLTGISATASDFEITSVDEPDTEGMIEL